jgi:putative transposase
LAAHQKKARRHGAYLALLDESGLLMAPLVRRSLAPKGQPPVLRQKSGHREKVSVAAALWLTPPRDRLGLFTQTLVKGYFNNVQVATFLGDLLDALGGPVVVIWDRGTMHKGDPIREAVTKSEGRLMVEPLVAYGSELMPVEQLWTWLKYDELPNFAPRDAHHLDAVVREELLAVQDDQERLKNFFHASRLPLPRALLS